MFRFANPHLLWLLLLVPAMAGLFAAAARNRRRRLARFGNPAILRLLMPDASPARVRFRFLLFCTAAALVVLAAARPQLGSKLREQTSEGIEMMLVVDVSNSMLAEDFEPNRLERTKYAIGKLFDGLRQDRVGMIVFAGDAAVQLPITSDYRMARAFARKIAPSLVSVQGTDIGRALSPRKPSRVTAASSFSLPTAKGTTTGLWRSLAARQNRGSASSPSASAPPKEPPSA